MNRLAYYNAVFGEEHGLIILQEVDAAIKRCGCTEVELIRKMRNAFPIIKVQEKIVAKTACTMLKNLR